MSFEVVSPCGEEAATKTLPAVPRLDTLEGKTVCEVWNGDFRGDESFPVIRQLLQKRYPTMKVVPYTEFPLAKVPTWQAIKKAETERAWRAAFEGKGCEAVITGNGN